MTEIKNVKSILDLPTEKMLQLLREALPGGDQFTDSELTIFALRAKSTGLDPLSNQITLITRGREDNRKSVIQTGIDGYRAIAASTGEYAGNDDYTFDEAFKSGKSQTPLYATATVYRLVSGKRVAFTATARWVEYVQKYRKNGLEQVSTFWKKFPSIMLGKCAESLALRKAFPQQLFGIYTTEEMGQAETEVDSHLEEKVSTPKKQEEKVVPQKKETQVLDTGKKLKLALQKLYGDLPDADLKLRVFTDFKIRLGGLKGIGVVHLLRKVEKRLNGEDAKDDIPTAVPASAIEDKSTLSESEEIINLGGLDSIPFTTAGTSTVVQKMKVGNTEWVRRRGFSKEAKPYDGWFPPSGSLQKPIYSNEDFLVMKKRVEAFDDMV